MDVTSTKIQQLSTKDIFSFQFLTQFFASNCHLKEIERNFLVSLKKLEIFILQKTIIENDFAKIELKNLKNIKIVKTDYIILCCLFWKNVKISSEFHCYPSFSNLRLCSYMIRSKFEEYFYWLFGVVGCILNLASIILIISYLKSFKMYELQLKVADFLISSYVLFVAFTDFYYKNIYIVNDFSWRKSFICQLLGTVATLNNFLE